MRAKGAGVVIDRGREIIYLEPLRAFQPRRIGMDTDKEINVVLVGYPRPLLQRDKPVPVAGHDHIHPILVELLFYALSYIKDEIFFS